MDVLGLKIIKEFSANLLQRFEAWKKRGLSLTLLILVAVLLFLLMPILGKGNAYGASPDYSKPPGVWTCYWNWPSSTPGITAVAFDPTSCAALIYQQANPNRFSIGTCTPPVYEGMIGISSCSGYDAYYGTPTLSGNMRVTPITVLPCPPNSIPESIASTGCLCDSGLVADQNRRACVVGNGPPLNPPPPPNTNPDKNNNGCGTGNPINPSTGLKFQVETDYYTATGLEFKRIYNSLGTDKSLLSGVLGAGGWQLAWQRSIQGVATNVPSQLRVRPALGAALTPYGVTVKRETAASKIAIEIYNASAATITVAHVTRGRGKVYTFNKQADGTWKSDADVNEQLSTSLNATGGIVGWTYTTADKEVEQYDSLGHLLSVTDLAGQTTTLSYSDGTATGLNGGVINGTSTALPFGLLIRITDAYQHSISLGYDAQTRIVKMTDPANGVYNYAYDGNGNLTSVTYPDGNAKQYLYENISFPHALTGIIDENASRFATYAYDTNGRAISTEHAGGVERVAITYNTGSSNITDARGTVRTQTYQVVQGVLKSGGMSQPGGSGCSAASNNMTYDANGNPATSLDFNGNLTTYTYDLARNLETSRTEGLTAAGAKTSATRTVITTWHPTYRLPLTITKQDTSTATPVTLRVTTLGYDTSGNLTSKTVNDPVANASRSWTYTYDTLGHRLIENGARTDVSDLTTYTYDTQGNLATVTNALNQLTTLSNYNAHGQPGLITDANGLVTTLAYDLRQRLIFRDTGGEATTYNYDGVGQLTSVITPSGATYTYTYDAAHRLTDITDNLGNHIHYTLDVMNNRTQEQISDAANNVVQSHSRTFDALNRLYQDIGAINQITTYAYDANGNLTRITDPLNRQTNQTYDALNRLITSTDAANGLSRYGYDAVDQLVKVTDPNTLITQYQRDGLGNLNVQVSPDTGTTINSYDAAGNLTLHADAKGQQANYSYDALNRVSGIAYTGLPAQSIGYVYDQGTNGVGHLTTVTDVTGATTYAYDAHGRLASDTHVTHGASYTTSYGYDVQGRLASLTYPSGRVVSYGFDSMGRINQISTTLNNVSTILASNISYEPFGGIHSFTFGDGLTAPVQSYVRQRDSDGRIASYTLNGKVMNIGYNTASELLSITDPAQPTLAASYSYDPMSRLTGYLQGSIAQGYSYDADGNRTSKTLGAATSTYNYATGSNRLASIQSGSGTTTLTQDANGATTNDITRQYNYDARGRLVQATTVAGIIHYEVNALGLRTRKQVPYNNTDTLYHYDNQGHLIGESPTGTPLVSREYIYLGDQPVAVMQ